MVATAVASYFLLTADYGPEPNALDPVCFLQLCLFSILIPLLLCHLDEFRRIFCCYVYFANWKLLRWCRLILLFSVDVANIILKFRGTIMFYSGDVCGFLLFELQHISVLFADNLFSVENHLHSPLSHNNLGSFLFKYLTNIFI